MKRIILPVALVWLVILGVACQSIENYQPASAPLFAGNYATPPAPTSQIKVITWNIRFAENINAAIEELQSVDELQNADILLLQEMDETGVEELARALGYNYVYYPASVHSHHQRNFGNAVLARWPIREPAFFLLPFENPKNSQRRAATQATISINGTDVFAYSVHTETIWLSRRRRLAQILALVSNIDDSAPAIVGGDFNTVTSADISAVDEIFGAANFTRVSADAGPTVEKTGIAFTLDHIFARQAHLVENGVYPDTTASDHFPVWVILSLEPLSAE